MNFVHFRHLAGSSEAELPRPPRTRVHLPESQDPRTGGLRQPTALAGISPVSGRSPTRILLFRVFFARISVLKGLVITNGSSIWQFPKIRGTFGRGLIIRINSILGSMLGSPDVGKPSSHLRQGCTCAAWETCYPALDSPGTSENSL